MGYAVMIDTLKYAQELEASGVSHQQAAVHARVLAEVLEDRLTTKQDLNTAVDVLKGEMVVSRKEIETEFTQVRNEISILKKDMDTEFTQVRNEISTLRKDMDAEFTQVRNEISTLRKDIENKFAEFKVEVAKWVIGLFVAQTTAMIAVVKLLH